MANCGIVNGKIIVPLFIRINDVCLRPCFTIVKNFAVDVFLRTPFMDRRIRRIIRTEQKTILWNLKSVVIASMKTVINFIKADETVYNMNTDLQDDTPSDEFNL